MRDEHDFAKGVRGKFYRPGAKLLIPVYLEPKVQAIVAERAAKDGTGVSEVVNRMLMREIAAAPAKRKKIAAGTSRKGTAQVVLLGTEALQTVRSRSSARPYVARDARGARAYRLNPIRKTRARTHAAKKTSKRAKR